MFRRPASAMSTAAFVPDDIIAQRYRVIRRIGSGGFGAVYEVETLATQRRLAVKLLHAAAEAAEESRKRFEREAALLKQLSHAHVVEVEAFGVTNEGHSYLALELLQGQPLARELARALPLSVERTVAIATQVLGALGAAHAVGIVHRDLKPANIFVCSDRDSDPFVKVLDFGIAAVTGGGENAYTRLTQTGQMVGTPQYMAPEQVMGGEIGPATDLYALGLVMAEALAGERLVRGNSDVEVLLTQAKPEPLPLPQSVTSSALAPIIERALHKRPSERFATAADMLAALQAHLPPGQVSETDVPTKPLDGAAIAVASAAAAESSDGPGEKLGSTVDEPVKPARAGMTAYQSPAHQAEPRVPATAVQTPPPTADSPAVQAFLGQERPAEPPPGFTELAVPAGGAGPPPPGPAPGAGYAPMGAPPPMAAPQATEPAGSNRLVWILAAVALTAVVILLVGAVLGALVLRVSDRVVETSPPPAVRTPTPPGGRSPTHTPQGPAGPLDRLEPEKLLRILQADGWVLVSADAHRITRQTSLTFSYQLMTKGSDMCNIQLYRYDNAHIARMASENMNQDSRMEHKLEGRTILMVLCNKGDSRAVLDRLLTQIR